MTPTGPVHTMFTVTGISTAGLSSTMQIRLISELIGRMGFDVQFDIILTDGAGTIAKHYCNYKNVKYSKYAHFVLSHT